MILQSIMLILKLFINSAAFTEIKNFLFAQKEKFIRLLTHAMQKAGVKLENRLHLSLSPQGDLIVEGDDNDTDKMREILSRSDLLQKKFRELAYISFLSYGIDMVCQAKEAMDEDSDEQGCLFSHFHAYIKGTLSHFYIK